MLTLIVLSPISVFFLKAQLLESQDQVTQSKSKQQAFSDGAESLEVTPSRFKDCKQLKGNGAQLSEILEEKKIS